MSGYNAEDRIQSIKNLSLWTLERQKKDVFVVEDEISVRVQENTGV